MPHNDRQMPRQVGIGLGMDNVPSRWVRVRIEQCICSKTSRSICARATSLQPVFRREAVGDPRFVFALRNGRDARPTTIARVRAYLEAAGTMNRLPLSAAALRLLKR